MSREIRAFVVFVILILASLDTANSFFLFHAALFTL